MRRLETRESLGSTGVGAGIAIPHAQVPTLDQFFGVFARLDQPIDYDAIDGQPVDLVFLLLIPGNTREHLKALAAISRRLRDAEIANAPTCREDHERCLRCADEEGVSLFLCPLSHDYGHSLAWVLGWCFLLHHAIGDSRLI